MCAVWIRLYMLNYFRPTIIAWSVQKKCFQMTGQE